MEQEQELEGGRRGKGRAALVMLWVEARLPQLGLRCCIANWKDVVRIAVTDPSWGRSDS